MFGMAKWEIYLIGIGLLIVVAAGAGGWCYHLGGKASDEKWELKQAKAVNADMKSLTDAVNENIALAKGTASAVAGIKVIHTTTKGVLEREIQTNTVYANDCLPASGIMRWNDISAGRPIVPSSGTGQQPNVSGAELSKANGGANPQRPSGNPLAQPRRSP